MKTERVHNELEANVLIKEAYKAGEEEKYNGTCFYTHDGAYLFTCFISAFEYKLVFPDGTIKTKKFSHE